MFVQCSRKCETLYVKAKACKACCADAKKWDPTPLKNAPNSRQTKPSAFVSPRSSVASRSVDVVLSPFLIFHFNYKPDAAGWSTSRMHSGGIGTFPASSDRHCLLWSAEWKRPKKSRREVVCINYGLRRDVCWLTSRGCWARRIISRSFFLIESSSSTHGPL